MTAASDHDMTPELLRVAGEAIYGAGWQSALARDYGVSDRTVRYWAAGQKPIPPALRLWLIARTGRATAALKAAARALRHGINF